MKKTLRKIDRALAFFFDPLAEKAGGAVNLFLITMLTILFVLTSIVIFFGDYIAIFASVTIFIIMVMASKILTRNKLRMKDPWWYRNAR